MHSISTIHVLVCLLQAEEHTYKTNDTIVYIKQNFTVYMSTYSLSLVHMIIGKAWSMDCQDCYVHRSALLMSHPPTDHHTLSCLLVH